MKLQIAAATLKRVSSVNRTYKVFFNFKLEVEEKTKALFTSGGILQAFAQLLIGSQR